MILTNCAACAAPLAHDAPRCVRCWTRSRASARGASNPAKGLVHYLSRLQKARWRGIARKIAKFKRKVQKYSKLAVSTS